MLIYEGIKNWRVFISFQIFPVKYRQKMKQEWREEGRGGRGDREIGNTVQLLAIFRLTQPMKQETTCQLKKTGRKESLQR